MSQNGYSEINFHITWHTKNNVRSINEQVTVGYLKAVPLLAGHAFLIESISYKLS